MRDGAVPSKDVVARVTHAIRRGADPLGDVFCALRSARERRSSGAAPTPPAIVDSMLAWAEAQGNPCRVADPGAGSARLLAGAGRKFADATLVAVESEPLAALTARGILAASGMAARSEVRVENFLPARLDRSGGQTMFVGNPPYVRHHLIPPAWKGWLKTESSALGVRAGALAGLPAYSFLAIAKLGAPGEVGALITSAEWLDVNYGKPIRDLFLGGVGRTEHIHRRTAIRTHSGHGNDRCGDEVPDRIRRPDCQVRPRGNHSRRRMPLPRTLRAEIRLWRDSWSEQSRWGRENATSRSSGNPGGQSASENLLRSSPQNGPPPSRIGPQQCVRAPLECGPRAVSARAAVRTGAGRVGQVAADVGNGPRRPCLRWGPDEIRARRNGEDSRSHPVGAHWQLRMIGPRRWSRSELAEARGLAAMIDWICRSSSEDQTESVSHVARRHSR